MTAVTEAARGVGADLPLAIDQLARQVAAHAPVLVLGGAGLSTASGIPDYRDVDGRWKQPPPMNHGEFMSSPAARRRYWARSMVGWPRMRDARPNGSHHALAALERMGYLHTLVTQNVDALHRDAGQARLIALHGELARVACTGCGASMARDLLQRRMGEANPVFVEGLAASAGRVASAADGDAALDDGYHDLVLVDCRRCGGVLKPDVVFFGESVPAARVARVHEALAHSGALLVVGSSLMVYSGYRFVRAARAAGKPVWLVNRGRTRADDEATLKIDHDCQVVLEALVQRLPPR